MADTTLTLDRFELLMSRLDQLDLIQKRLEQLEDYLAEQHRRAEELEELKQELVPIANQMIKVAMDELAEIGNEFKAEDLFYLLKRLLRDTPLLLQALDLLEALTSLGEELNMLMKPVFNTTVKELDRLEQQGYFAVPGKVWRALTAEVAPEQTTFFALLKALRDPQVRIGIARVLHLLKVLGEMPQNSNEHQNLKGE
ncbi:MAG: DUF1641 domain-containing protein [Anaerolineales bacterium]|nr:DUF1641 domain-containing protein [Anaerolineales bacterium]MDW8445749.1 DUF1641 domain-containing protein [Anaerolineales bacterium]